MIFEAVIEALPAVETGLRRGLRHQFILDDELQKHAAAIVRREIGELGANFGGREIEIGLLDVDTVDLGDDRVVGTGSKRNASNEGRDKQQGSPSFHGVRSSSCARLTVAGGRGGWVRSLPRRLHRPGAAACQAGNPGHLALP